MSSMTVKLTWDEDLGPNWMNKDNLALLLFNKFATRSDLLQVTVLDHTEWHGKVPDETPKSLEEIARLFIEKIKRDARREALQQIDVDQFGFSLDVGYSL